MFGNDLNHCEREQAEGVFKANRTCKRADRDMNSAELVQELLNKGFFPGNTDD